MVRMSGPELIHRGAHQRPREAPRYAAFRFGFLLALPLGFFFRQPNCPNLAPAGDLCLRRPTVVQS
jgi:hypothetical protein